MDFLRIKDKDAPTLTKLNIIDGLHEIEYMLWFYKTCNEKYLGKPIGKFVKSKITTGTVKLLNSDE